MAEGRLGRLLIQYNIIDKTQLNLFNYGMTVAILLFVNLIAALIISLFLGTTLYCAIFIIAFVPLRRYSGGFHASNPVICFIESQLLLIIGQLVVIHVSRTGYTYEFFVCTALICAIMIFLKSPIYSRYKPLNPAQEKVYGCAAKALTIVYSILMTVFYLLQHNRLFLLMSMTLLCQGVLLLIPEREHKKVS